MGVDPGKWTLRQLFAAREAKHRAEWEDRSIALHWILAYIPNMSSKPRPVPTPRQINPYHDDEIRDGRKIPLKIGDPAAAAALDAWAARAAGRNQSHGQ